MGQHSFIGPMECPSSAANGTVAVTLQVLGSPRVGSHSRLDFLGKEQEKFGAMLNGVAIFRAWSIGHSIVVKLDDKIFGGVSRRVTQ